VTPSVTTSGDINISDANGLYNNYFCLIIGGRHSLHIFAAKRKKLMGKGKTRNSTK